MSKCLKCVRRKAKRACPALGSPLCPVCCGTLRVHEIPCPSSCRFLAEHKPYQDRRRLERTHEEPRSRQARDMILNDDRLTWLVLTIEASLHDIGKRRPDFTDGEAILALEYAKEALIRGRSLLVVPGQDRRPRNDSGESVFQSMENCRYERSVILLGGSEPYKTDDKLRCLDHLILNARSWARDDFDGRTFLERLAAQFAEIQATSTRFKLITPG